MGSAGKAGHISFDPAGILGALSPLPVEFASHSELELRKKNLLLGLLADAAGYILSTEDPDELVRGVFHRIKDHTGVDTYFNYMVNRGGDAMELASCWGIPDETARKIRRLEFGQAICGLVAVRRRPIVATHIQESSEPMSALVRSFGIRAYACNPLIAGGRLLGTLSFASRSRDTFDEDELDFFRTISRYVELAKERIRLAAESDERATRLADTEDRLRLAVEATALGTWHFSPDSGKLECSDLARKVLGLGASEGYEDALARVHEEDRDRVTRAARAAFDPAGAGHFAVECRVAADDGAIRWIAAQGQAYFSEDGALGRFVGTVRDITEHRQIQEKLGQTAKLESLGLLAGGVAHDFNNLLTGIMGNSSLACELIGPQHDAAPLLEAVLKTSERAADLTRQLLAYAGKARGNVRPLDLSALVREVGQLIRSSIPLHVELSLNLGEDLPGIRADSTQLQQVIMNLILNAAEAVPADRKGSVVVKTALKTIDAAYIAQIAAGDELSPGEYVSVEVEDNGAGMDEATQKRIFDPFFTTKVKGRGLGLSAVLGIVRAHHGAIRLYSVAGRGTVFRVLLPQTSEAAAREAAPSEGQLTGSGTVLVVDDDDATRGVAETALTHYGYRTLTARNGREALDLLLAGVPVDAVILDLQMPVMSGEEALPRIAALRPGLKVIVCTGYGDMETAATYAGSSIAGFMQKPYTAAALARKVRAVMG